MPTPLASINKLFSDAHVDQAPAAIACTPSEPFIFPLKAKLHSPRMPTSTTTGRYRSEFDEVGSIGKGGFGVVVRARNRLDGREYAVKKVPLSCSPADLADLIGCFLPALVLPVASVVKPATISEGISEGLPPKIQSEKPEIRKPKHSRTMSGADSRLLREVKTFANISDHPNVIRYYSSWIELVSVDDDALEISSCDGDFDDDDESEDDGTEPLDAPAQKKKHNATLYIQMQLCPHSDLRNWLMNRKTIDKIESLRIFQQIVEALRHVHERGIVHRDLTPANIFVDSNNVIYLGDFGLAKSVTDHIIEPLDVFDSQHLEEESTPTGTYIYSSPEQVNGGLVGVKTDVYSLGVVLAELFSRFETAMERAMVLQTLKSTHTTPPDLDAHPLVRELVLQLISDDPEERPSAQEILTHPIFDELDAWEYEHFSHHGHGIDRAHSRRRAASISYDFGLGFVGSSGSSSSGGEGQGGIGPVASGLYANGSGGFMQPPGSRTRRSFSNASGIIKGFGSDEETLVGEEEGFEGLFWRDPTQSHSQPLVREHHPTPQPSPTLSPKKPHHHFRQRTHSHSGPLIFNGNLTDVSAKERIKQLEVDVERLTQLLDHMRQEKTVLEESLKQA